MDVAQAEESNKEFEEFRGKLEATLAAAKVQKDGFNKWISANMQTAKG